MISKKKMVFFNNSFRVLFMAFHVLFMKTPTIEHRDKGEEVYKYSG